MSNPVHSLKAIQKTQATAPIVLAARCTAVIPSFDELPDSALVRQAQLVRDPKNPTRPAPLPFSPATFWRKVKDGTFPAPIKLGDRITCWKVGAIREWLAQQETTSVAQLAGVK